MITRFEQECLFLITIFMHTKIQIVTKVLELEDKEFKWQRRVKNAHAMEGGPLGYCERLEVW